jgi:hypothetical protein
MEDTMKESGPTTRRRAAIAIAALLGVLFALLPATPANAAGTVAVGYPSKTGVTWTLGTTQQITWSTAGGLTGPVKIQLYDAGVGGAVIKASTAAETGAFTWAIPVSVATSTHYRVRVASVATPAIYGESANEFTIAPPVGDVLVPDGGESWGVGTRKSISWDLPVPGNAVVQLNTSGTLKTIKTTSAAAGAFDWDIPLSQATGTGLFKIRVASATTPAIYAESAAPFSITAPTVSVTAPGATTWLVGTSQDITWTAPFAGNVRIELVNGSVTKVLKASTPAKAGRFTWDIPLNLATGTAYRVKVTATDNPLLTGLSAASLSISVPTVSAVTPSGGTIAGNTKQVIAWTPGLVTGNVKIELTGGPTPILIKASIPAAVGTFNWDVPLTLSTAIAYRVRITSVSQSAITASSALTFTATEPIPTLSAPANGVAWVAGTTRQIVWNYDVPGNVSISLFKGGAFVSTIKASMPAATESFSWTIPMTLAQGANYSIEVKSLVNKLLLVNAPAAFTINLPTITSNNPGTLIAGTTESLTWTPVAGTVRLAYTVDNVTFTTIKASVPGSQGSFSWDVPVGLATVSTYRILVASTSNPTGIKGVSTTFQVDPPVVTLTTPSGTVTHGTNQVIAWTSTLGLHGNVKIEVTSGGVTKVLKASTSVSTGQFNWVVPTNQTLGSTTVKVTLIGRTDVSSSVTVTVN